MLVQKDSFAFIHLLLLFQEDQPC